MKDKLCDKKIKLEKIFDILILLEKIYIFLKFTQKRFKTKKVVVNEYVVTVKYFVTIFQEKIIKQKSVIFFNN